MTELPTAFYKQLSEGEFEPTVATQGPWSPDFQHGGPPSSLLTHALRIHPSAGPFRIIRITIEILNAVPVTPCEITVEVVRGGRRIDLLRGEYRSGGKTYLIAHAWRVFSEVGLTRASSDAYDVPLLPEAQTHHIYSMFGNFPYVEALEWRFSEGGFDSLGPATVWTRPRMPLIENRKVDGLEALVLMIDSANGISAELDFDQWTYVPVDMTVGILRPPEGTWFGMEARTVIGDDGSGQTTTVAFDSRGTVGRSLHTLFIRPR